MYSSTSGSTGGFRQTDPSLRKWQSLSHLVSGGATRTFPPSPGVELRAARCEGSVRQAEGVQWLQDAHKHLDTQLDQLRTRNSQLNKNITTAQLLDMKHKVSSNRKLIFNVYVNKFYAEKCLISALFYDCTHVLRLSYQKQWVLLSRRRRRLNYPSVRRVGNVKSFTKSKCSKTHGLENLED